MNDYSLETILKAIENEHSKDPNSENSQPAELLYSNRMIKTLKSFSQNANEIEIIASACQHFRRWECPRNDFPLDKKGYYQWKKHTHIIQAQKAESLLKSNNFEQSSINAIKDSILKKDLASNPLSQKMEDITCLVFIKYYLEDFGINYNDDKTIGIILKTWRKMSNNAQEFALTLNLKERSSRLIHLALS